jgi:hypothetical protein
VCARCADIGEHPFENLDDTNMALLVARTREWMRDREFPRSDSEREAMRIMEQTLVRMDHLDRIARNAVDVADKLAADELEARRHEDGPTDDEIYNRVGVEGGIAYDTTADEPGSLGENDWRL